MAGLTLYYLDQPFASCLQEDHMQQLLKLWPLEACFGFHAAEDLYAHVVG
jgi:hypothetical protein